MPKTETTNNKNTNNKTTKKITTTPKKKKNVTNCFKAAAIYSVYTGGVIEGFGGVGVHWGGSSVAGLVTLSESCFYKLILACSKPEKEVSLKHS